MENEKLAISVIMLTSPFVAWASYGLGLLIDRMLGRSAVNGASVFNWLTLGLVALAALANKPELFGRLLAAFAIAWLVGRHLSKQYKRNALASKLAPEDGEAKNA